MLATGRQKVDGATGALTTIKFHDDTLYAQERDGAVFVAIGPICDGLGIDWREHSKGSSVIRCLWKVCPLWTHLQTAECNLPPPSAWTS